MQDDDFGFSLTSTTELKKAADMKANDAASTIADLLTASRKDLDRLYDLFKPLLNNLSSDPSKDIIQWNGQKRVDQMRQFKLKVEKFIENSKRRV